MLPLRAQREEAAVLGLEESGLAQRQAGLGGKMGSFGEVAFHLTRLDAQQKDGGAFFLDLKRKKMENKEKLGLYLLSRSRMTPRKLKWESETSIPSEVLGLGAFFGGLKGWGVE